MIRFRNTIFFFNLFFWIISFISLWFKNKFDSQTHFSDPKKESCIPDIRFKITVGSRHPICVMVCHVICFNCNPELWIEFMNTINQLPVSPFISTVFLADFFFMFWKLSDTVFKNSHHVAVQLSYWWLKVLFYLSSLEFSIFFLNF